MACVTKRDTGLEPVYPAWEAGALPGELIPQGHGLDTDYTDIIYLCNFCGKRLHFSIIFKEQNCPHIAHISLTLVFKLLR